MPLMTHPKRCGGIPYIEPGIQKLVSREKPALMTHHFNEKVVPWNPKIVPPRVIYVPLMDPLEMNPTRP